TLKWGIVTVLLVTLIVVYKTFNPEQVNYFPSCPFKSLTGFLCAGCGSQRAVHSLLNLELAKAFHYNSLLVIAIPYLLLGAYFDLKPALSPQQLKLRSRLYGIKAIWAVFTIVILFWVLRNIL